VFDRLPQSLRYMLVGGVAAATDLVFFGIFHMLLGFDYLVIGVIGFLVATGVNYLLSIRWVFESGARFARDREWMLIYLVSLAGLGLHVVFLYIGVEVFAIEPVVAKVIAIGLVFSWNYGARKYYVFSAKH